MNQIEGWPSYLDGYMVIDEAEHNAFNRANDYPETKRWYIGSPKNCLLIYEVSRDGFSAPAFENREADPIWFIRHLEKNMEYLKSL